ncbi:hypothetical protein J3458_001557 [Metarhizium acridum]|uniref:uncharacterized protein n=1 Tax=Metarhizium acridum TaxID=92637 RepID=UPI001C6B9F3F|nr:hypothetical protein J3458_001557 [Metarhizium acridum]
MSMETVRAIVEDSQLRHTYMALVSMLSDTSREAAGRYGVSELTILADDLDAHLRNRAGLLGGLLSGFLGGNRGGNRGKADTGNQNENGIDNTTGDSKATGGGGGLLGNLLGGGGGGNGAGGRGGGLISNAISGIFGNLLSKTGDGLAGAGFFGGVGAGEGAAQGLSLAPASRTKSTGQQVAAENGMKNTGLNPIIQNAAKGLTATAVKAFMGSKLLKMPPLGGLGTSLGSGIGNGAAMGLGLSQKNSGPPLNGTNLEDAVGGFGFGASQALTSSLNGTRGLASFLPPIDVGATVADFGTGIGKGAAVGLKLTNNTEIAPPPPASGTDIPRLAGTLAFGVSQGLTGSLDTGNLNNLVPSNLDIGGTVLNLGTGLGGGAAAGLKLVAQNKNLAPPPPKSLADIPGIAGTFGFGLSNSFTDNINVSAKNLASMLPPIDFGAAALDVGSGIGNGAALGLKLANVTSFAPPPPGSPLDIPKVAGTLAFGVSKSLTDSVNVSNLAGNLPGNLDIGGAALSVGAGLGSGAARGLKLTSKNIVPPTASSAQDIPGIAGSLAFGLSDSLTNNINLSANSLGSMLPPIDFGTAALNVGTGLGKGAAVGLKLTQNNDTGFSTPSPASAADIPKIAGSLAFGLSRSLSESVNTSNVGLGNALPANFDLGSAVLGAGRGLGSGTSLGLGLASNKNFTPPMAKSQSDIPGLAETFTFGLGNSFTDKINVTSQMSNLGSMLPPIDFGATALNTGAGLGLGAAKGLQLTSKALAPASPANISDIPNIAGNFAFGLSDAVAGNLNTTDLLSRFSGGSGMNALFSGGVNGLVSKFGAPAASGLGKGLGKGAAIGLGLQPDGGPEPLVSAPAGDVDIAGITQNFAEGLSSRFLANGTVTKVLGGLSNGTGGLGSLTSSIDIPGAARGFTRGLITGAGDGVQAIGGINAILNGTSKPPTAAIPDSKVDLNDSTGSAAVGFGQGLGSSGVVTLQRLLAQGINLGAILPGSPKAKRDVEQPTKALALASRDESAASGLNLSSLLSTDSVSAVAQKGVDALTCDGFAGVLLVSRGLQNSGAVSFGGGGLSENVQNALRGLIPKGMIRVTSQGNTFDVDGKRLADVLISGGNAIKALSVNGFPINIYTALVALHVGAAVVGLFFLMPFVMSLTSLRNILTRLRVPDVLPKWTPTVCRLTVIFGVIPSLVLLPVFGVLAASGTRHFRTAHGVLGLITFIVAIAAVVLYFYSKPAVLTPGDPIPGNSQMTRLSLASNLVYQLLSVLLFFTAVTGYADLSSVTLCLTRAVVNFEMAALTGMALVPSFVVGQFITGSELLLVYRARRRARNASKAAVREKT